MKIIHFKPKDTGDKYFVQMANSIVDSNRISEGAKILYMHLKRVMSGDDVFDETALANKMGTSRATVVRRKKELIEAGLVHFERVTGNHYVLYLGTFNTPAKQVKRIHEMKNAKKREIE